MTAVATEEPMYSVIVGDQEAHVCGDSVQCGAPMASPATAIVNGPNLTFATWSSSAPRDKAQ